MILAGENRVWSIGGMILTGENKVWSNGGMILTGENRVWSIDGMVLTGENRVWSNGEMVLTGENRVWSNDGMILTGENLNSETDTYSSAALSTINSTMSGLKSNPYLGNKQKNVARYLSNTVTQYWLNVILMLTLRYSTFRSM
jgi:hypothetical protein